MKIMFKYGFVLSLIFILTGCQSTKWYSSNGAKDNRPLLFEGEYVISDIDEIEVQGKAIFGIPSFSKNNKNNFNNGHIFEFNGLPLGKVPRILPILTMLGYSFGLTSLFASIIPINETKTVRTLYGESTTTQKNLPASYAIGALIGVPLAGIINNFTWPGASLSGSYANFKYQLVTKNPNIDLFFYPKYEIINKNIIEDKKWRLKYLFIQESTFKCRLKGATIINTPK
jgi:hypothetical protein